MNFFRMLLGLDEERNRKIDSHVELVNIRLSIENEAEHNFQIAYGKLTDKQKKIVEKKSEKFAKITGFVFPRRSDYLDNKRYYCEELLEKQGISKEDLRKEYVGFLNISKGRGK